MSKDILKNLLALEADAQLLVEHGARVLKNCHDLRMKLSGVSTSVAPPNILSPKDVASLKGKRRRGIIINQSNSGK